MDYTIDDRTDPYGSKRETQKLEVKIITMQKIARYDILVTFW